MIRAKNRDELIEKLRIHLAKELANLTGKLQEEILLNIPGSGNSVRDNSDK